MVEKIIGNMDTKDVKRCESSTLNWTNSMRIENDILKQVALIMVRNSSHSTNDVNGHSEEVKRLLKDIFLK
ncbi:hypothetical protein ACVNP0_05200 [Staphylococcus aureus]